MGNETVTSRTIVLTLVNELMSRGLQLKKDGEDLIVYNVSTRIGVKRYPSFAAVWREYLPHLTYTIGEKI